MMDETQPNKKASNKLEVIATIAMVAILVVSISYLAINSTGTEQQTAVNKNNTNNSTGGYTSFYTNVTAEDAYNLINTTSNLTVLDCRAYNEAWCECKFSKAHLPGAILSNSDPPSFYNSTNDILVYSLDGNTGAEFCDELVNHVYCKIYNLEGGYDAWINAGYPTAIS